MVVKCCSREDRALSNSRASGTPLHSRSQQLLSLPLFQLCVSLPGQRRERWCSCPTYLPCPCCWVVLLPGKCVYAETGAKLSTEHFPWTESYYQWWGKEEQKQKPLEADREGCAVIVHWLTHSTLQHPSLISSALQEHGLLQLTISLGHKLAFLIKIKAKQNNREYALTYKRVWAYL